MSRKSNNGGFNNLFAYNNNYIGVIIIIIMEPIIFNCMIQPFGKVYYYGTFALSRSILGQAFTFLLPKKKEEMDGQLQRLTVSNQ